MITIYLTSKIVIDEVKRTIEEVDDPTHPALDLQSTFTVAFKKIVPPIIPDGKLLTQSVGGSYDIVLPYTENNLKALRFVDFFGRVPNVSYKAEMLISGIETYSGRLYIKSVDESKINAQFVSAPTSKQYEALMAYIDVGFAEGFDGASDDHAMSTGFTSLICQYCEYPRLSDMMGRGWVYVPVTQSLSHHSGSSLWSFLECSWASLFNTNTTLEMSSLANAENYLPIYLVHPALINTSKNLKVDGYSKAGLAGANCFLDCMHTVVPLHRLLSQMLGLFGVGLIFEGLIYYMRDITWKPVHQIDMMDLNGLSWKANLASDCYGFFYPRGIYGTAGKAGRLIPTTFVDDKELCLWELSIAQPIKDFDGNTGYPNRAVIDKDRKTYTSGVIQDENTYDSQNSTRSNKNLRQYNSYDGYQGTHENWQNKFFYTAANCAASSIKKIMQIFATYCNCSFEFIERVPDFTSQYQKGLSDGQACDYLNGINAGNAKNMAGQQLTTPYVKVTYIDPENTKDPFVNIQREHVEKFGKRSFVIDKFKRFSYIDVGGKVGYVPMLQKQGLEGMYLLLNTTEETDCDLTTNYLSSQIGGVYQRCSGSTATLNNTTDNNVFTQGYSYAAGASDGLTGGTCSANTSYNLVTTENMNMACVQRHVATADGKSIVFLEDVPKSAIVLTKCIGAIAKQYCFFHTFYDYPFGQTQTSNEYINKYGIHTWAAPTYAFPSAVPIGSNYLGITELQMFNWWMFYEAPDILNLEVRMPIFEALRGIMQIPADGYLQISGFVGKWRLYEDVDCKIDSNTGQATMSLTVINFENLWYKPKINITIIISNETVILYGDRVSLSNPRTIRTSGLWKIEVNTPNVVLSNGESEMTYVGSQQVRFRSRKVILGVIRAEVQSDIDDRLAMFTVTSIIDADIVATSLINVSPVRVRGCLRLPRITTGFLYDTLYVSSGMDGSALSQYQTNNGNVFGLKFDTNENFTLSYSLSSTISSVDVSGNTVVALSSQALVDAYTAVSTSGSTPRSIGFVSVTFFTNDDVSVVSNSSLDDVGSASVGSYEVGFRQFGAGGFINDNINILTRNTSLSAIDNSMWIIYYIYNITSGTTGVPIRMPTCDFTPLFIAFTNANYAGDAMVTTIRGDSTTTVTVTSTTSGITVDVTGNTNGLHTWYDYVNNGTTRLVTTSQT